MHSSRLPLSLAFTLCLALISGSATAQTGAPPPDESLLGPFVVTGHAQEHVTKLAILPSLSPDLEDVIVRGVVRRDFELSGLFDVIPDRRAPSGLYGFDDPVDVNAWRKIGAEVIVKVAARRHKSGQIQVFGLCYFLNVGKDPVYEKTLLVPASEVRVTAHRITDALLGAITGRPGGFASRLTFAGRWGSNQRIFTMDSDGNALAAVTDPNDTSIAPTWGPHQSLYFSVSRKYSPFWLARLVGSQTERVKLSFTRSVYGVAFNKDYTQMAVAVAVKGGSAVYLGQPDGSGMKRVSRTVLATHPVFSPSGKLAWIGGDPNKITSRRVYVDGKAVSPAGFSAAAPTFCDTEDGIRLVYSVSVGNNAQDLVLSAENGGGIARLTQHQGSNTYPACSIDGRLLAFFSTRSKQQAMYLMSLKRWKTQKLVDRYGESLRWVPLPPPAASFSP